MENGNAAATPGGDGDRRNRRDRRKTVSGALPPTENNKKTDRLTPVDAMRFPWSSPSAPTSPASPTTPSHGAPALAKASSGHKHTFSGSILAKIHFLRNLGEDGRPPSRGGERSNSRDKEPTSPTKSLFSRKSVEGDVTRPASPTSPKAEKENALSAALKQSKTRKRKGSLRKTALLGGRHIISEGRERKGSFSLLQRSPSAKQAVRQETMEQQEPLESSIPPSTIDGAVDESSSLPDADSRPQSLRRQFSYESPVVASSSDSGWSEPPAATAARLSLVMEHKARAQSGSGTMVNDLGSPVDVKSPTSQSQTSYTSTTDDDDVLTFDRPVKAPASSAASVLTAPLSSAATSYFPSVASSSLAPTHAHTSLPHRRTSKHTSPLSLSTPLSASGEPYSMEPHDYTETAYWGWVILFATWLTFTVGMGSCLEIWSWAWDVGQTPYAPPELEDDPTLPIVGYYPALMVLTGVVALVWITVAWVGMKYFRHAKIEV